MEIDLPAYEDIYDFNEADLNFYQKKISECLKTGKDLTEKWQRKGQRVLELIHTELEERIAINQISSFCSKEQDSELYKEVFSEGFSQGSTDLRDSVELTLGNEEVKEESVSEKMWNMRKSKKNYKDFVRNTLKNTQQAVGLVIGGSSVPVVKANKLAGEVKVEVKEKGKRDTRPEVKKGVGKVGSKVGDKGEKKGIEVKSLKEEKKSVVQGKVGVKEDIGKKGGIDAKKGKIGADEGGVKKKIQGSGKEVNLGKDKEVKKGSNGIKVKENEEFSKNLSTENREMIETKDDNFENLSLKEDKHREYDDEVINREEPDCKEIRIKNDICGEHSKEKLKREDVNGKEYIVNDYINSEISEERLQELTYGPSLANKEKFISDKKFISNELFPEQKDPNTVILISENISTNTSDQSLILKEIDESSKFQQEINSVILSNTSLETSKIAQNKGDTVKSSETKNSFISTENTSLNIKSSNLDQNTIKDIQNILPPNLNPIVSAPSSQPFIHSSKSSSSDAQLIPNLSESNSSDSIESITDTKPSDPVPEYKRKTEPNFDSYHPDLEGLAGLKALKQKILSSDFKTPTKVPNPVPPTTEPQPLPPVPSSNTKPVPKPAAKPKKLQEQYTDYTSHYSTFFEIFAGHNLSKDFSPLISLRESLQTFKEFINLIDSPEFEVHKKFKLTLAPLEINPRDLVRGEDHNYPVFPSEKEMYYRVVKARPEVYDIVSRGLNKKKAWSELPHGLNLRLSWNLMWTWSKPSLDFGKLLVWQVVNHFPETKNFSRKDMLKKNIEKIMKVSAKANNLWNIIPITYVLPKEYVNFVDHYGRLDETEPDTNVWIMKPVGKSRGRGISVINDVNQVSYGEIMVIQRYISNPLLLQGYKFDLRLYILITKFSPLEAFLYKEGFARMSTVPFSMNPDKLQNKFIHLTNFSIQKYNTKKDDSLDSILGGSKICLKTLQERLEKLGINWDKIWSQIIELIIKSLIAVQHEIPSYPCCFDLVGYDVMIDENLQTWLVEINSSPSLARENYLDDLIKQQLIDDTLELVNPLYFNKQELVKVLERRTAEVQKGHINNTVAQMNQDLHKILDGKKPRKYGEVPEKLGNYEMISPSGLYDKLYKVAYPRG